MINTVQSIVRPDPAQTGPEQQAASPSPPARPALQGAPASSEAPAEAAVRLTIDAAEHGPGFVYTLRDRVTGRILVQLPRQEAVKLGERPGYKSGDLIRTEV